MGSVDSSVADRDSSVPDRGVRREIDRSVARAEMARTGMLCRRVVGLIDDIWPELGLPHLQDQLRMERRRLLEPLRVAVAGRVSAGKSTLVNALLGMVMAPTGAGETTRIITWYMHGNVETAELSLRDGRTRQVYLCDDGSLPDSFGLSADEISCLTVKIPAAPLLADLTVVDTPGISSARQEVSQRTERSVLSGNSQDPVEVDALVFLLHGQQDEIQAIEDFRASTTGFQAGVLNVVGVVSRADQLGDEDHPLEAGARRATRLAETFRLQMVSVVPVIGLLAETVRASLLTRADHEEIGRIARDADPLALMSADLFLEGVEDPRRAVREHLLSRLGLFGLRVAVEASRRGVGEPDMLAAELLRASGFPALQDVIHGHFVPRADVIKADRALAAINRLSYQVEPAAGRRIRAEVERVTLSPQMHQLREIWALQQCSTGQVKLPGWLLEDLLRLSCGADVWQRADEETTTDEDGISASLLQTADRLCAFIAGPFTSARQRQIAEVALQSIDGILHQGMAPAQALC